MRPFSDAVRRSTCRWNALSRVRHGRLFVAAAVIAAVVVTACGARPPSSSATPTVDAASVAPIGSRTGYIAEHEIAKAVAFRQSVGLRHDRAWVETVAAGPEAEQGVRAFGVPLTTVEVLELRRRARTADAVTSVIQSYARSRSDTWAGLHVEDGLVVGRFTDDIEAHQAALRVLLAPNARWALERARWTLAEMQELRDRIAHDGWLRTEGYDLVDLGADIRANVVQLHVSSARPDAAERIALHYGAGDILVVTSDGTGVASLPTGDLGGIVVDVLGRPVDGLDVEVVGDIPGSGPAGDRGIQTDQDGEFRIYGITATGYELRLLDPTTPNGAFLEGAERILVRSLRVEVVAGAVTFVQVTVAGT